MDHRVGLSPYDSIDLSHGVEGRYKVNGKSHSQEAKHSPFSLVQQQPGEFAVSSIAHQHKLCRTAVTDLRYTVHPLPSARVGHGKRVIQDIHEGNFSSHLKVVNF